MTCSTCGAEVGTQDTMCGSCGVATATLERLPAPPASPPLVTGTPAKKGHPRSSKVVAIVAAVAVVLAVGMGVSRTQVAHRLSSSEATVRDTSGRLDTSQTRVDQLAARVTQLEEEQAKLHTQLDKANAGERDARTSLSACQEAWRMAVQFAHDGTPPPAIATEFAAKLVSCFEGKVPPSLF